MNVEIKGKKMVITLDMIEPTPSSTGKSQFIATTHGHLIAKATYKGQPIKVNVMATIPAEA